MARRIVLDDIEVDVVFKDIKNVHLSVHPPTGRVTVAAPQDTSLEVIRAFTASKCGWIKRQKLSVKEQGREAPREFIDRESHWVWGRRYLLRIEEKNAKPSVERQHSLLVLRVRPQTSTSGREALLARWYRLQVQDAAQGLLEKWTPILKVSPNQLIVRRMKTMWGSYTERSRTIRLNTELAKKPPECLEYILVHELVHLHERTHNHRFVAILDQCLPDWRSRRNLLNDLPVRHEEWSY